MCVRVFYCFADTVNCIFPESCQPLMKARAWLVQSYSWDPEELDLLGRKHSNMQPTHPYSESLSPTSWTSHYPEGTTLRLNHADGNYYFAHRLICQDAAPILYGCLVVLGRKRCGFKWGGGRMSAFTIDYGNLKLVQMKNNNNRAFSLILLTFDKHLEEEKQNIVSVHFFNSSSS